VRKFVLAVFVALAVLGAMLVISLAQNDGCLPWQEPVGSSGSPFAGTEDRIKCR
jgi:hypothetical protein